MPREYKLRQKRKLTEMFGGTCQNCGYSRSLRALQFHHIDSSKKSDWSNNGGASYKEIEAHPERFMLLCANCHFEEHERIDDLNALKVNCMKCGREFYSMPDLRRANQKRQYCSITCANLHRREMTTDHEQQLLRIQERCIKEGDCSIWQGHVNSVGIPLVSIAVSDRNYKHLEIQRVLFGRNGIHLKPFARLKNVCGNKRCINLEHWTYNPNYVIPNYPPHQIDNQELD